MSRIKKYEEYVGIINNYDSNKMNVSDYCELVGISKSAFYKYKKKIENDRQNFIDITYLNKESSIDIVIGNAVIKVNNSTDISLLNKVIKGINND